MDGDLTSPVTKRLGEAEVSVILWMGEIHFAPPKNSWLKPLLVFTGESSFSGFIAQDFVHPRYNFEAMMIHPSRCVAQTGDAWACHLSHAVCCRTRRDLGMRRIFFSSAARETCLPTYLGSENPCPSTHQLSAPPCNPA